MATQIFHLDLFEVLPNVLIRNTRCNYGAEMMALNVGRFDGLDVGHVPKCLNIGEGRRVQVCHTSYRTGVNACKISDSADMPFGWFLPVALIAVFATYGWMLVLGRGH